jgi:hypothetical protein
MATRRYHKKGRKSRKVGKGRKSRRIRKMKTLQIVGGGDSEFKGKVFKTENKKEIEVIINDSNDFMKLNNTTYKEVGNLINNPIYSITVTEKPGVSMTWTPINPKVNTSLSALVTPFNQVGNMGTQKLSFMQRLNEDIKKIYDDKTKNKYITPDIWNTGIPVVLTREGIIINGNETLLNRIDEEIFKKKVVALYTDTPTYKATTTGVVGKW